MANKVQALSRKLPKPTPPKPKVEGTRYSTKPSKATPIMKDVKAVAKKFTTNAKGAAKTSVNEAAGRAASRLGARVATAVPAALGVAAAGMAGYAAGTALNNKFKLSDKLVNYASKVSGQDAKVKEALAPTPVNPKPKVAPKPVAETPKKKGLSNFGKAFKATRASGKKEFSFGGKRYNTKMK